MKLNKKSNKIGLIFISTLCETHQFLIRLIIKKIYIYFFTSIFFIFFLYIFFNLKISSKKNNVFK